MCMVVMVAIEIVQPLIQNLDIKTGEKCDWLFTCTFLQYADIIKSVLQYYFQSSLNINDFFW